MLRNLSTVEPSGTYLLVNNTAVKDGQRVLVQRGVKVNLRCSVTAEPRPRFIFRIPDLANSPVYRHLMVRGIRWEISIDIRSMNCRNSGAFICMPYNPLGSKDTASVTFELLGLYSLHHLSLKTILF